MSSQLQVGGQPIISSLSEVRVEDQPKVSPQFEDALVKPDIGGGTSFMSIAKTGGSYLAGLSRYTLGGLGYAFGAGVSTLLGGTVFTVAKSVGDLDHMSVGEGIGHTLQGGHEVGKAFGGAIVGALAPEPSDPPTVFGKREHVTEMSGMFDDVQGNDGVPKSQKDVIRTMDDLGDRAYRRTGFDKDGKPVYEKMSKDEYRTALLHGAHVVVKGSGTLEAMKGTGVDKTDRSGGTQSSHYTKMKEGIAREQWGVDLPMEGVGGSGNGFGHLLMGKTSGGDTFFQLEGHGTGSKWQKMLHTKDFFTHVNSLSNVGPQGVIDMTEGNQTHIVIAPEE